MTRASTAPADRASLLACTIIGIAAPPRSGKRRLTDELQQAHGFRLLAFSEPLYVGLSQLVGAAQFQALASHFKDEPLEPHGGTMREALNNYGTLVREAFGATVLIDRLEARLRAMAQFSGPAEYVIADVTLPGEVAWVRRQGGAIWWLAQEPGPGSRTDTFRHFFDSHVQRTRDPVISLDEVPDAEALADLVRTLVERHRAAEFAGR